MATTAKPRVVQRCRKKPVIVEAVQLCWGNWADVVCFLGTALVAENPDGARMVRGDISDTCGEPGPEYIALEVRTIHGEVATVRHGDWIIPDGEPGRFYPCKPDIFEATYEPVEAP
jgi:hypothetical protein